MESTIVGYILGLYGDNGKMETTIVGCILGLYRNNGKIMETTIVGYTLRL